MLRVVIQEFADRKLYDIPNSRLKRDGKVVEEQPMYGAGAHVTVFEEADKAAQRAAAEAPVKGVDAKPASAEKALAKDEAKTGAQTLMDAQLSNGHATRFLFTTKTCPNCKIAKEMLKGKPYEVVDAEENLDLVSQYGVMQAPTLIVLHDGVVDKYVNASNIKRYVDQLVSNA